MYHFSSPSRTYLSEHAHAAPSRVPQLGGVVGGGRYDEHSSLMCCHLYSNNGRVMRQPRVQFEWRVFVYLQVLAKTTTIIPGSYTKNNSRTEIVVLLCWKLLFPIYKSKYECFHQQQAYQLRIEGHFGFRTF